MPPKTLVINGHGAKTGKKLAINQKHRIITPGKAEDSYVISFDNMERHLEEMTCTDKIWPIQCEGEPAQWHHYHDTLLDDIKISPLQKNFSFIYLANDLLRNSTRWDKLTIPPHDVLVQGALAVKMPNGQITIYEGAALKKYLYDSIKGTKEGVPLFFCDKVLGKVKPLGMTTLSDIYAGIALIEEFKTNGTQIIVATCSAANEMEHKAKQIKVITKKPPMEITKALFEVPSMLAPENTSSSSAAGVASEKPTANPQSTAADHKRKLSEEANSSDNDPSKFKKMEEQVSVTKSPSSRFFTGKARETTPLNDTENTHFPHKKT